MKRSTMRSLATLILLAAPCATAFGQQPAENHLDTLPKVSSSTTTVTPIFSQLLVFSMPKGFAPVGSSTRFGKYTQQSVPFGQTVSRWTEMITVAAEKDAARMPRVNAQKLAEGIAGFFRKNCPDSFGVASFGPLKVERYDGFATVISCGIVDAATPQSEALLLVTIAGENEMFTLQWAERGPPSKVALPIDPQKWQDRLARIAPVRLCAIVPGESPPYPSCMQNR